jgi:hypothetical protein
MQAQICITLDGQVSVITREGTFEAGRQRTEALLNELAAGGLEVSLTRPVEQHRHDPAKSVQDYREAGRAQAHVEAEPW